MSGWRLRIDCVHGYFKLTEEKAGQAGRFLSYFQGLELEWVDDYFTFSQLKDAPDYSLQGGTFLGAATPETFEGPPWEVMRANRLVYDFDRGLVVSLDSVSSFVTITQSGAIYLVRGLILPGSITEDGSRVTDYSARYSFESGKFQYSRIETT